MEINKTYVLDLNNISNFIFGDENARTHDTEITETYEPEEQLTETENGIVVSRVQTPSLTLTSKTIHEVKGSDDNGKFTVRYDMFKMLLNMLDNEIINGENLTIGQRIAFNTMLSYGLIKEIEQ